MDPLDPAKNIEGSGFSKRRISSILKAPRKSAVFRDSEQQENEVEIARPVEKRNSRRVSFAPANDVLLFAKDVKTGSPTRSPLQELMAATTATTQNRAQVVVPDDGAQEIMGIENLLNAPLHASQQLNMVSSDGGSDFGEKTVMFSTEDAVMDMTCSHTINIASDTDLLGEPSHQRHDILLTGEKRRATADDVSIGTALSQTVNTSRSTTLLRDGNKDSSVEMRNVSATVPFVNSDFENFLASLSKPSSSSINRMTPLTGASSGGTISKTQTADVDKENQFPKSLGSSRNIGEPFKRSAFFPKNDMSLGMTAAHTGHTLENEDDDDDDPFQCLFPTQEMYTHSDKRPSQTTGNLEKSCRLSGSEEPKVFASFSKPGMSIGNPEIFRMKPATALSNKQTVSTDSSLLQHKTQKVDIVNEGWPRRSSGDQFKEGIVCPEDDISMDMTEAQTGCITGGNVLNDPSHFPSQESQPVCEIQKKVDVTSGQQSCEGLGYSNQKGMETSSKSYSKTQLQTHQEKLLTEDDHREKTVRFSTDDVFIDDTQSHTGNTDTDFRVQLHQSVNVPPPSRELPVRLTADDTSMDMTQCFTVNIDSDLVSDSVTSMGKQENKMCDPPQSRPSTHSLDIGYKNLLTSFSKPRDCSVDPVITQMAPITAKFSDGFTIFPEDDISMDMTEVQSGCTMEDTAVKASVKPVMKNNQIKFDPKDHCRDKTVRFTAADAGMDVTQCHTVNIIRDLPHHTFANEEWPANGEKTVRFTTNDAVMDVTRSHTVNISTDLNKLLHQNANLPPADVEKTVRFTTDDAAMDVTRSHTVNISSDLNMMSEQNVNLLQANGEKTVRFTAVDARMYVTQSHTVNIIRDLPQQTFPNVDLPANGEKTMRFTTDDAAMEVTRSHTVNISSDLNKLSHLNVNLPPADVEKTVRFATNDAAMDVTRSHTVNISSDLNMMSEQNVNLLRANGEKTVRFTTNAAMDVTQSHTVNIIADLNAPPHQKMDLFSANREKTVRFTTNDAAMDVTRSHTVNISTDLNMVSDPYVDLLRANGEKTELFSAKDAAVDVTQSHTVNISANVEPRLHQKVEFQPSSGDKTMRFTTNDASMDMTSCFTVNIASYPASDSVLPDQNSQPNENMDVRLSVKKTNGEDCGLHSNLSSSAQVPEEFNTFVPQKSDSWADSKAEAADAPLLQETTASNDFQINTQQAHTDAETESPSLVSAVVELPVKKTMTDCVGISPGIDKLEPQPDGLRQVTTDNFHQSDKNSELTSQHNRALGSSTSDDTEVTNPLSFLDSNEKILRERQPRTETFPLSQKTEPSSQDQDGDTRRSRTSRRMSLADLQSKVRRLSHIIKAASDTVPIDGCTAPLPQLDPDLDKNSKDETTSSPAVQPQLEMDSANNTEAEQPSASVNMTPFSLKTQQLMSTLSVGGFKPKLPQRNNPDESKKMASAGEATRTFTISVTNQLSDFDHVGDINDEELGSCGDMSETLDTSIPEKISEKEGSPKEFYMFEPLHDFQAELCSPVHGQKRPLQDGESKDDEKRLKSSTEHVEMEFQPDVECDSNVATTRMTTQTIDSSSSSHTGSRCEAVFDSTNKHSLFESMFEDCESDGQKKLKDGTITVQEFFKLFNIDFVIHNPRQSVLPGKLLSETDASTLDILKNRHISRPKQMIYETDIQALSEKVEGLKVRMRDLDKPLKTVNGPLWEEIRHLSENEIKSFGAKLKERNNVFRKLSKVQSHEMKEVLYSNLVRANLEEQQKLRGTIEEADEMIKSLDDYICELESELFVVEEKGSEDEQSLKTLQEELTKVAEALGDGDRQTSELEMEKNQSSSKVNRLKAETKNLESHSNMLSLLNEWRLREKKDDCTVYTFLYETLFLQLVYEKPDGNDSDGGSEKKITNITFKFELDDEKSQFHVRLVHKLVSQYISEESAWVEKYPTRKHVPELLHDVSLVVSRCRLLGEELRLLKMWGSLRFDILDISCTDTQVHIVFSSLEKFSKFEVVFNVSLTDKLCLIQVRNFKNMIGNTTIQQIEEIVASSTPTKNALTKIVRKIHESL